jgi:hypothetical protein
MTASQLPLSYACLRVTKPYPTGGAHRIDAAWKAKVEAALKEKGKTKKWLAIKVGCDPSAITVVLRPSTVQSRLMPAINEVLGLGEPPPTVAEDVDELDAALMRALQRMDEGAKRHLLGLAEALMEKPRRPPRG